MVKNPGISQRRRSQFLKILENPIQSDEVLGKNPAIFRKSQKIMKFFILDFSRMKFKKISDFGFFNKPHPKATTGNLGYEENLTKFGKR